MQDFGPGARSQGRDCSGATTALQCGCVLRRIPIRSSEVSLMRRPMRKRSNSGLSVSLLSLLLNVSTATHRPLFALNGTHIRAREAPPCLEVGVAAGKEPGNRVRIDKVGELR